MMTLQKRNATQPISQSNPLTESEAEGTNLDFDIARSGSLGELLQALHKGCPAGVIPNDRATPVSLDNLSRLVLTAAARNGKLCNEFGITPFNDFLEIVGQIMRLGDAKVFPTRSKLDWELISIGEALKGDLHAPTIMVGTQQDSSNLGQQYTVAEWREYQRELFNCAGFYDNVPVAGLVRGILAEGLRQGVLV